MASRSICRFPRSAATVVGNRLGAEARYGLSVLLAARARAVAGVDLAGQRQWLLPFGILMVMITELTTVHQLVRPFLGIGILGGYTTLSTAMLDVQQLALAGRGGAALGYLTGTVATAVAAALAGALLTRVSAALLLRRQTRWRESA